MKENKKVIAGRLMTAGVLVISACVDKASPTQTVTDSEDQQRSGETIKAAPTSTIKPTTVASPSESPTITPSSTREPTFTPEVTQTATPTPTPEFKGADEVATGLSWMQEAKLAPGVTAIYSYSEDEEYIVESLTEGEKQVDLLVAKRDGTDWVETTLEEKYSNFPPITPDFSYQETNLSLFGESYLFSSDSRWRSYRIRPYWTGKYIVKNWNDSVYGAINVIAARTVMRDLNGKPVELNIRIGSESFEQSGLLSVGYVRRDGSILYESFGKNAPPGEFLDFIDIGEQVETALTYLYPDYVTLPLERCRPEHKVWCEEEYTSNYRMFEENERQIAELVKALKSGSDTNLPSGYIVPIINSLTIKRLNY